MSLVLFQMTRCLFIVQECVMARISLCGMEERWATASTVAIWVYYEIDIILHYFYQRFYQNIELVLYLCSFEGSVNLSELAHVSLIRELDTDSDATKPSHKQT